MGRMIDKLCFVWVLNGTVDNDHCFQRRCRILTTKNRWMGI
jgi:hypothetical protein